MPTISTQSGVISAELNDVKPNYAALRNWLFLETDTNAIYYHNGSNWVLIEPSLNNRLLLPNRRKHAYWYGSNVDAWNGFFSTAGTTDMSGETVVEGWDNVYGFNQQRTTGNVSGNMAGWRLAQLFTIRAFNPYFFFRFKLNQTGTDQRLFIGPTSRAGSNPANGDDELNAQSGIMLSLRAADTVFQIMRNDGSGASVFTNVEGNPTVDTNVHTIEFLADENGSRWFTIWDGDNINRQSFTTEIPGSTTRMGVHFIIQTATAATKRFDQFEFGVSAEH